MGYMLVRVFGFFNMNALKRGKKEGKTQQAEKDENTAEG
jgi:hypothetical protein